jgi:hypothetical protein
MESFTFNLWPSCTLQLNARELCKLAGVETVAGSEESSATPTALLLKGCAHLAYEIKKLGTRYIH